MFSFLHAKRKEQQARVAVSIDSGVIKVALVVTQSDAKEPDLVWSEQLEISRKGEKDNSNKALLAGLLQLLMTTADQGRRALHSKYPKLKLSKVDVILASPYSHTISKRGQTNFAKPTRITEHMLVDMARSLEKEVTHSVTGAAVAKTLNLSILSSITTGLTINGYRRDKLAPGSGKEVILHQLVGLCDKDLYEQITEVVTDAFPAAELTLDTLLSRYYRFVKHSSPRLMEACLANVTAFNTEFLMIFDGVPKVGGVLNRGKASIIEDLVEKIGISEGVAHGLLSNSEVDHGAKLSVKQQEVVASIFKAYEDDVTKLLKSLDGVFTAPKVVYAFVDGHNFEFFATRLQNSIQALGASKVKLYQASPVLFKKF